MEAEKFASLTFKDWRLVCINCLEHVVVMELTRQSFAVEAVNFILRPTGITFLRETTNEVDVTCGSCFLQNVICQSRRDIEGIRCEEVKTSF